ncbi:ATP-binding cassette domain-containing protein [Aneurinibacillus thermoaerophilus]|uniref:ABC transporter ATP-binding protein n=1 Tax=Aneurinibacillus thermoaerophilus TaxID=143495 RepID=UPI002E1A3342|nr:ATP-binding cassette domain-containing protein [Aneurinibacillus thermoaerophilus]MED0677130.1 ATP-binding cassette domain-containing protein [Aneurinibacillus thermoaerophilus]
MATFEVKNLTFCYPGEEIAALSDISFTVAEGEFIVLCGPSGCGKTTLLRHFKKELMPVGTRTGEILYNGKSLVEQDDMTAAAEIGMVLQNPENQMVMDTVWHELAFSMENLGYSVPVMRKRLAEIVQFFGLERLLYMPVHELSGGQQQMINLASVLLLQPRVLLLDEPTAQLDPVASREFLQMIRQINDEFSLTVIMCEHRLEEVLPLADRVLMLQHGRMKYQGTPEEMSREIAVRQDTAYFSYLPSVARLYLSAQSNDLSSSIPLTVREGKRWLQAVMNETERRPTLSSSASHVADCNSNIFLECHDIAFQYKQELPPVLQKLTLTVYEKELLAILGGNGTGKSTLLQVMGGMLVPQRGSIWLRGRSVHKIKEAERYRMIGYLAQNPLLYFLHDTVEEELWYMADYVGSERPEEEISYLLSLLEIEDVLKKHPHDLSGGQQQKVALALILLSRPHILLVDEPTKGMDPLVKERFAELLDTLRAQGMTVVMVTHDIEFAARHASRCALLFDGAITTEAEPSVFFSENYFYTTAINRVVRQYWPEALTYEDVMDRWRVLIG